MGDACKHGKWSLVCTDCEAELKQRQDGKLISMGMDLGVYALAQLFATGKYTFTQQDWEMFGWQAAQSLERETGQPAEDLAMEMMPIIEAAIKQAIGDK